MAIFDTGDSKRVFLRSVIAFKRLGRWVYRVAKNRVNPNRKKHPEMERTNVDFKKTRRFFARMKVALENIPTWRVAAVKYGGKMTGDNFMFHVNYDKLVGGSVACFHLFRFSVGSLFQPWDLSASREGNVVTVTWHDNRISPHCSPDDVLLAGLVDRKNPRRPMLLDLNATRSSGTCTFELNPNFGKELHFYFFFCNRWRTEFSSSQHVELTGEK